MLFSHTVLSASSDMPITVGSGFTVIVVVAVFIQPLASVPVTVYVAVPAGVNATPSATPPVQVYVVAPIPDKVTEEPVQTALSASSDIAITVGSGFTVIVAVAVFIQPFTSVPVTVYVAVPAGVNATPLVTPPVHV